MKNAILSAVVFLTILSSACSLKTTGDTSNLNVNPPVNVSTTPESTPESAAAQSKAAAAEALIADLYKQHDAKKSPFFQKKNRGLVDNFFTKRLGDLIWKDAKDSSGEVGAIDADPLYNAQDIEIKNFAVGTATVKNDTATLPVTFTNFGAKQTVTFNLKQSGGAWKIDNIGYGDGDSLMKWLTDTGSDQPAAEANGEFEGKYQVGETTCLVKPVKMAFEIKWAKGTGTEMFAFTENNSFASAPGSSDSNKFVFDDENYNSGTFYRADGKTFLVKRLN